MAAATGARRTAATGARRTAAFTLIEMLVVIAIIGVLAAIGLPALRGLGRSNKIDAANRQLLDDLWLARALAMQDRTTVYMVFVPPNAGALFKNPAILPARQRLLVSNVVHGQYTSYALLSLRSIGDQPGQDHPRYLTPWKSLPEGMIFATNKLRFVSSTLELLTDNVTNRPVSYAWLPFPTADSPTNHLPCLAFNAQGQLVPNWDVILATGQGSVFYQNNAADVAEAPPNNHTNNLIWISWLTGRAKALAPELK
jgi:prepilin-type N-terminal cleavage/methylation domain-containing protein